MGREPRRGLYARAGLAGTSRPRLLSAPPPISAWQFLEGLGRRGTGLKAKGGGLRHWSRRRPGLELGIRDCPNWAEEEERDR